MASILRYSVQRYLSNAARVEGPSAVAGGHGGGSKLWRNLTYFVAFPAITLCVVNCYMKHQEEEKHFQRPPFVPYEYMRIRTKRFPWGEGQKSLFHNPHVNALPNGYEEEH